VEKYHNPEVVARESIYKSEKQMVWQGNHKVHIFS